jgi:glycosyltransferase involved in cell wall biosynthesis
MSAPLRVLHVNAGNRFGGVETMLLTLAKCRDVCPAMQSDFAVCYPGRLRDELAAAGATVYELGAVRTSRPWAVIAARTRLRRLIETARVDIIVCHMPWALAVFGPPAQASRVPLVFWAHGLWGGNHWIEHWSSRVRPVRIICNSYFTAESVTAAYPGVPADVVVCPVCIPAGVSPNVRLALRSELSVAEQTIVIIQASRMEPCKGHRLLIEALANLKGLTNWNCWIVGGPQSHSEEQYMRSLIEVVERLDLSSRVRFLGERSDVPRLLLAADIHCQPNLGPETFGLTFIEALHAGLPVVTTRLGGAVEILGEAYGVLVPPKDAARLAAHLGDLILSPRLRHQFAAAGPARARQLCDPAQQISALHSVLHNVHRVGLRREAAR